MSRLTQSLKLDVTLQWRNYIYFIVVGTAAALGTGLALFFEEEMLRLAVPFLFITASGGTGYIFIGALVLFEKRENTLTSLIVTPLRPGEYLQAKLVSMVMLVLTEGVVLVIAGFVVPVGGSFNLPLYLLGVVLTAAFFTLAGFIVVVRYDAINEFLIPSIAITSVLTIPAFGLLDIWQATWLYAIPSFPMMLLVTAAFRPIDPGRLVYALAGSAVVLAALYSWALRAFRRHVVEGSARRS